MERYSVEYWMSSVWFFVYLHKGAMKYLTEFVAFKHN